ncbi:acyl-CoA-like ligand-binding transcription factor [Mycolicibacterium sp. XJ870]
MTDWRERKKAATRQAIQDQALRLFAEKGYDATTVEEISAAAGVSHMTFFRYFPRKEEVVEYDEYDPMIEELIAARPASEPPLAAIHHAIRAGLEIVLSTDREPLLQRTRLVLGNSALRARNVLAQDETRALFARALARRAGLDSPDLACAVQAAAALATITPAITAWADSDGADLIGLIDAAFAGLAAGVQQSP